MADVTLTVCDICHYRHTRRPRKMTSLHRHRHRRPSRNRPGNRAQGRTRPGVKTLCRPLLVGDHATVRMHSEAAGLSPPCVSFRNLAAPAGWMTRSTCSTPATEPTRSTPWWRRRIPSAQSQRLALPSTVTRRSSHARPVRRSGSSSGYGFRGLARAERGTSSRRIPRSLHTDGEYS